MNSPEQRRAGPHQDRSVLSRPDADGRQRHLITCTPRAGYDSSHSATGRLPSPIRPDSRANVGAPRSQAEYDLHRRRLECMCDSTSTYRSRAVTRPSAARCAAASSHLPVRHEAVCRPSAVSAASMTRATASLRSAERPHHSVPGRTRSRATRPYGQVTLTMNPPACRVTSRRSRGSLAPAALRTNLGPSPGHEGHPGRARRRRRPGAVDLHGSDVKGQDPDWSPCQLAPAETQEHAGRDV